MFQAIPDLISVLTSFFPPEVLAILAVVLGAIAVPTWINSIRTKQLKTRLRWHGRSHTDEERERWEAEAFELAAGKGRRLVSLADEALKLNQLLMFRRALDELKATEQCPADVERLEKATLKERPRYRHPVEAAVVIEKLIEQEMFDEARTRLVEAYGIFPGDPDLAALESALAEHSPAV